MKAALLQLTSSDDPVANLAMTAAMVADAAGRGAEFVLTPENTNFVSADREVRDRVLQHEADDITLAGLRQAAKEAGVWLLIGSLSLKTGDADGRYANRSFLIGPDGGIVAWYDKVHMFDVQVNAVETYRESATIRPGDRAVTAETPWGVVGLTICYDVRFAYLHRMLAQAGARILTAPAAFSTVTGAAHWEVLLRARAIETGCFVLAPAQTGTHPSSTGQLRKTWGHSLAVAPWGEVLLDAGTEPGVYMVDLDLAQVDQARGKVPALTHDRAIRPGP
jgi:predicted amidohydrolase